MRLAVATRVRKTQAHAEDMRGGGQPCAGVCVVCVVSLPPVFWRAHVCAWQGSTGSAAGRKTQDKLQWIVAQRLLSALTTPGFSLSHLQKSYRIQHPKRR